MGGTLSTTHHMSCQHTKTCPPNKYYAEQWGLLVCIISTLPKLDPNHLQAWEMSTCHYHSLEISLLTTGDTAHKRSIFFFFLSYGLLPTLWYQIDICSIWTYVRYTLRSWKKKVDITYAIYYIYPHMYHKNIKCGMTSFKRKQRFLLLS